MKEVFSSLNLVNRWTVLWSRWCLFEGFCARNWFDFESLHLRSHCWVQAMRDGVLLINPRSSIACWSDYRNPKLVSALLCNRTRSSAMASSKRETYRSSAPISCFKLSRSVLMDWTAAGIWLERCSFVGLYYTSINNKIKLISCLATVLSQSWRFAVSLACGWSPWLGDGRSSSGQPSLSWSCLTHFRNFLMISIWFWALSTKWVSYFVEPDLCECHRPTCRLWSGRPMVKCQLRTRSFLWVGSLGLNSKIMHRLCCICLPSTVTRSERSSLHEF